MLQIHSYPSKFNYDPCVLFHIAFQHELHATIISSIFSLHDDAGTVADQNLVAKETKKSNYPFMFYTGGA